MKVPLANCQLTRLCLKTFSLFLVFSNLSFAEIKGCQNPLEMTLKDDITIKFCEVPAANGIAIGSETGNEDERPVIKRNFEKSFHMGQYEVTQLQFKTIVGSEPWKKDHKTLKEGVKEGDHYPAVYVTVEEAKQFARILSIIDSTATYRLPSEAEWEYAARADSTTKYYWGDHFDSDFAFYKGNSIDIKEHARIVSSCPNSILDTKSPGYCANNFGLMHMLGNVSEHVADDYLPDYKDASTNGHLITKIINIKGWYYVVRGGDWIHPLIDLRSSNRWKVRPGVNDKSLGFRILRMAK